MWKGVLGSGGSYLRQLLRVVDLVVRSVECRDREVVCIWILSICTSIDRWDLHLYFPCKVLAILTNQFCIPFYVHVSHLCFTNTVIIFFIVCLKINAL